METKYDLIVLGWGKAGKTLAAKLGANGKKVAIIEKDPKMYGGTCINVGCLPTKSLVHSAKILNQLNNYGIKRDYEFNNDFFKKSMEHKNSLVLKLNKKNFGILNDNNNVDIYNGIGRFISENQIEVTNGNDKIVLTGENIVINTGATSRKLNILGADNPNVIYSNQCLNLSELPKKFLIVGAGYIGLEFASYFANFGSKVTVFQFDESFLPREDEADSLAIKEVLTKQGINFMFNTSVKKFVNVDENSVKVVYISNGEEKEEVFDKVLIAAGRVPNIQDLDLEKANVEVSKFGEIVVCEKLKTSNPHIWAAGDVKGGPQFTYISLDDQRIILPQLLGKESDRSMNNRVAVATTTFIDPPFSRVGLNEKEATKLNINFTTKMLPTMAIPKAHVINETAGFSKLLVNDNDEIIGAVLFHYEAHEMINLLSIAIQEKIKHSHLKDFIYTHPTYTESLNDL